MSFANYLVQDITWNTNGRLIKSLPLKVIVSVHHSAAMTPDETHWHVMEQAIDIVGYPIDCCTVTQDLARIEPSTRVQNLLGLLPDISVPARRRARELRLAADALPSAGTPADGTDGCAAA
jgi:hypothetical protein